MKDLHYVIANGVVKNFNRVAGTIEAYKNKFITVAVQRTLMDSGSIGMKYVLPRLPVFERRRHINNFRLH